MQTCICISDTFTIRWIDNKYRFQKLIVAPRAIDSISKCMHKWMHVWLQLIIIFLNIYWHLTNIFDNIFFYYVYMHMKTEFFFSSESTNLEFKTWNYIFLNFCPSSIQIPLYTFEILCNWTIVSLCHFLSRENSDFLKIKTWNTVRILKYFINFYRRNFSLPLRKFFYIALENNWKIILFLKLYFYN